MKWLWESERSGHQVVQCSRRWMLPTALNGVGDGRFPVCLYVHLHVLRQIRYCQDRKDRELEEPAQQYARDRCLVGMEFRVCEEVLCLRTTQMR
jgi:hypothetical protein